MEENLHYIKAHMESAIDLFERSWGKSFPIMCEDLRDIKESAYSIIHAVDLINRKVDLYRAQGYEVTVVADGAFLKKDGEVSYYGYSDFMDMA